MKKLKKWCILGIIVCAGLYVVKLIAELRLDKAGLEEFAQYVEDENNKEEVKETSKDGYDGFKKRRYIKVPMRSYEGEE